MDEKELNLPEITENAESAGGITLKQKPVIIFNDYEKLKKQAEKIAEFISSTKTDEKTAKRTKKILAKANKAVYKLNEQRKAVKNEILKPVKEFEAKCKEIEEIIKTAETAQRKIINELEDKKREEKRKELIEFRQERLPDYDFGSSITFERIFKPSRLNLSANTGQVKSEMLAKMETMQNDIDGIRTLKNAEKILPLYFKYLSVAEALKEAERNEERQKEVKKIIDERTQEKEESAYAIRFFKKADFEYIKIYCQRQKIKFETEE